MTTTTDALQAPPRSRARALRLLLATALALVTLPVLSSRADAETVNLSPSTVAPGGTINLSGGGCFTNATPPLTFRVSGPSSLNGAAFESHWSGVTGAWTASVVVPANASPGTYAVTVRCVFQFYYPVATFTVTGGVTTSTTTTSTTTTSTTTTSTTSPGSTTSTTVAPPANTSGICDSLARVRALLVSNRTSRAQQDLLALLDQLRAQNNCR